MTPRPITSRERHLIHRYSYCQLGMTPQAFYAKWNVSQEAIAIICSRSVSTAQRWFRRGYHYRRPTAMDLRHLALMDFLLDYYEQIPDDLHNALCPGDRAEESP